MSAIELRPATQRDASDIVVLGDIAGHGLPILIWRMMMQMGENSYASVLEVARDRVLQEDTPFSWRNAMIAETGGEVAGMLVGYRQPDSFDRSILNQVPDVLRPLLELEGEAPGSWYINQLAVFAAHRGKGIGAALVANAEERASRDGADALSLIVEDTNEGARRLYRRLGFEDTAGRPFVGIADGPDADEWLLMVKQLAN